MQVSSTKRIALVLLFQFLLISGLLPADRTELIRLGIKQIDAKQQLANIFTEI